MTRTNTVKIFVSTLTVLLMGCADSTVILKNRDFNNGDWLLVNNNHAKGTMLLIDNEEILKENPNGLKVKWSEDDAYTTCDGCLKLFKNGELVAEQDYLDESCLTESSAIKSEYKKGSDESVYPYDLADFKKQWDSLKNIPHCYPTRYHAQPDDKDIIWFYKYK